MLCILPGKSTKVSQLMCHVRVNLNTKLYKYMHSCEKHNIILYW